MPTKKNRKKTKNISKRELQNSGDEFNRHKKAAFQIKVKVNTDKFDLVSVNTVK